MNERLLQAQIRQEQEIEAMQEANAKLSDEDYRAALLLCIPLAEEGNSFAQFNIGLIAPFFLFKPSEPDLDIDRSILTEDAELASQFGARWHSLPDWTRAEIKWYTRAAAEGNAEAIFQLLHLYNRLNLGAPPWHSLTGRLRELYDQAENGGYFAGGPALLDRIRTEMREVGLDPKTVFHTPNRNSTQEYRKSVTPV